MNPKKKDEKGGQKGRILRGDKKGGQEGKMERVAGKRGPKGKVRKERTERRTGHIICSKNHEFFADFLESAAER